MPQSVQLASLESPSACSRSSATVEPTAECVPAHFPSFGSHRRRFGLFHALNFCSSQPPILPRRSLPFPRHPLPRFARPWSLLPEKPFLGSENRRTRCFVSAYEG